MGKIEDLLEEFGNDTVSMIQANMDKAGSNASGDTRKSLRSTVSGKVLKVSGKDFIYVLETGRKPGKRPPIFKILKWLNTVKASVQYTIDDANKIATKISKEGTTLHKEGGRKDIITPAISNVRINKLMSDIADAELKDYANDIETT